LAAPFFPSWEFARAKPADSVNPIFARRHGSLSPRAGLARTMAGFLRETFSAAGTARAWSKVKGNGVAAAPGLLFSRLGDLSGKL